jgi:hypothetical protein
VKKITAEKAKMEERALELMNLCGSHPRFSAFTSQAKDLPLASAARGIPPAGGNAAFGDDERARTGLIS